MKKFICLLLAVLLLASLGTAALAEETAAPAEETAAQAGENAAEEDDYYVIDRPMFGFHYVIPEKYRNLKGSLSISSQYLDDGLIEITPSYYAFPTEDFDAYNEFVNALFDAILSGEEPPVPANPIWGTDRETAYLYDIFIINADRGEKELREELKAHNGFREDNFTWLEKIGSEGEFTFFAGQYAELEENMEEYREYMGEEYFSEFEELITDRDTFFAPMKLSAPEAAPASLEADDIVSFETTDLDGNPVSSKDLFAGSKVTMINLWATWCGACKKEFPELAKLAKEFEKNGCQIVGICLDADEEDMSEVAKEILKKNGVDYLNIVAPEGVEELLPTISYPTSFFFDSKGRMLVEPVRGAYVDQYLPALNAALERLG